MFYDIHDNINETTMKLIFNTKMSVLRAKGHFVLRRRICLYDIKRYILDENSFIEELVFKIQYVCFREVMFSFNLSKALTKDYAFHCGNFAFYFR